MEKTVFFDYNKGRSREGPAKLLRNLKGYLQTDGYKVYDYFENNKEITHLNCMAHACRGFEKALGYDKEKAEYALGMFQKLYDTERQAKENNLSPNQRHELRLDKSLPVLNELGKWIAKTYKTVLPKSPIGLSTTYCISRRDKLMNYLLDGSLEIDNNLAENANRPIALVGTCKKNNLNPFDWLKRVLEIIPEHKANKLHELLPQNLKL